MREACVIVKDEDALKAFQQIKSKVDDGFDVEIRKAPGGGYKVLCVNKTILKIG